MRNRITHRTGLVLALLLCSGSIAFAVAVEPGVLASGGDRKTLGPGGHVIENNHIHHYSRWNRMYRPAIAIDGAGNRIAHNLIDNAPHMAIGFSGNDHTIEFNEIHSVCFESNDAGAIYAGRNWSMRGHVIRHNYLHDIYGHEGKGCVGVYLDDQFSSARIEGNLFVRVPNAAFIGGGRDCAIENNLFINCSPAIHIDARGLGWAGGGEEGLVKLLKAMPFDQEPWKSRYPELLTLLDDPQRMAPRGNIVARNIQWNGKWSGIEKKAMPFVTFDNNLLGVDPLLVDETAGNYALKPESPALKAGFKPIPLDKIGLYKDAARASWPVQHEVRPAPTHVMP